MYYKAVWWMTYLKWHLIEGHRALSEAPAVFLNEVK